MSQGYPKEAVVRMHFGPFILDLETRPLTHGLLPLVADETIRIGSLLLRLRRSAPGGSTTTQAVEAPG